MISLNFFQLENIGFIYIKDLLTCCSPYGTQLLKNMHFFTPEERCELERELNNITRAIDAYTADKSQLLEIEHMFMRLKDVRRSVMNCGEGALGEVELFEIKRFLMSLESIAQLFLDINSRYQFEGIIIPDCKDALLILNPDKNKIVSFQISDSYSPKLAEIRRQKRDIERRLRAAHPDEKKELKAQRQTIVAQEDEEQLRIRHELSVRLKPFKSDMLLAMDMIGKLDYTLAKARLAMKYNAQKPVISDDFEIELHDMINPQISDALLENDCKFTPVTINACKGVTVITGANMGGKSVALKTIALNVMLFHAGMFVFAKRSRLPMLEHLCLISEELEDSRRGLSSFGGEIMRLKEEIAYASMPSLMLFDEFARGTNPEEGARIVRGLIKHLSRQNAISVLTTHYDGVAKYANAHYRVVGLRDFSVDKALKNGEAGVAAIARHMNYGLYRTDDDEVCPKDAMSICKLLLNGELILDALLEEY